jgi:toxin YoeB
MKRLWDDEAWNDYLYWQSQDKKTLRRINQLLKDIDRNGHEGIGKPEPLKYGLQGYWSRRIDDTNRLVYKIEADCIKIAQYRTHYRN